MQANANVLPQSQLKALSLVKYHISLCYFYANLATGKADNTINA